MKLIVVFDSHKICEQKECKLSFLHHILVYMLLFFKSLSCLSGLGPLLRKSVLPPLLTLTLAVPLGLPSKMGVDGIEGSLQGKLSEPLYV